ncbi:hypothetical protein AGMMS49975_15700 [Clostridia bacterium]|nr:hypothetical protein AGMMS49975_15700 [Clostridia bacterium]GHU77514.1 hypothetical protein FACS1894188_11930 [Clostridia bacterium]
MNKKLIDVTTRQILRGYCLQIIQVSEPYGLGADVIKSASDKTNLATSKDEIISACNYLKDKGLVQTKNISNKQLGIECDILHLTPHGTDVLEGTAVVDGIVIT